MNTTIERLTGLQWRGQGPAFLVGLGHGATHWIIASFYVLLPFIAKDLGLTYAQAGGLITIFHTAAFAANAGSGAVVDISGRRVQVLSASLVVGASALMAVGLMGKAFWLVPLVVLIGITNNTWHPAAISYLSISYPENRGYALSIHSLGASFGDMVSPLAAGAILLWLTWQGTASLSALPVFAVAAILLVFLPRSHSTGETESEPRLSLSAYLSGLIDLVRNRAIIGLSIMSGFRSMTQNGLLVFLPLYLVDVMLVSPIVLGVAMMGMQIGGIVAGPIAGILSDRIGRQPIVFGSLTATTVIIIGLTMISNVALFIVVVALLGFVLLAVRPVIHSWAMDMTPDEMSGSTISLLFATQSAFSALVPLVGGIIADAWGLSSVFYALAVAMVAANVMVYFLPDSR